VRISNIFFKIVFIAGVCAPFIGNAQVLQGSVIDIKTKEGLIGASVFIESISKGVNTDESGNFTFRDIPQGTYTVKASYSGYKTQVQYQVLVQKGVTPINFELEEASVELEGVEILASPFTKTAENPVSIKSIGLDQIRSNPGGNFDISKVVQSLPGVSGSVGFRNDIIVRGGAPNENVFYVDGEVPPICSPLRISVIYTFEQESLNFRKFIRQPFFHNGRYYHSESLQFSIRRRDLN